MKLVIQIPCWNEEPTIQEVIHSLPGHLEGIEKIEIIIIDDGSTDQTALYALQAGAHAVVPLRRHLGLASAFSAGIEEAIRRNADILVNTDADMQYPSSCIADILKPILENKADIVIGDRLSYQPAPFPPLKMFLEKIGSWVVRRFSGTTINDAASGFRAFNKEALHSLVIHDEFSYTLESLLLMGIKKFRLVNVPIPTNSSIRKSRLSKNIFHYMMRSMVTIIRGFLMYHPLKFFATIGMFLMLSAFCIGLRFLYFYLLNQGAGHIQSLILLAVLALMGFQCIILGFLADVVAANRRLLENQRIELLKKNAMPYNRQ
jgi:glycosyltransferase involved in cell wall biosynthesis